MYHLRTVVAVCLAVLLVSIRGSALDITFIADIHYDPLYGSSNAYGSCTTSSASIWGKSGCDASHNLMESVFVDSSYLQNAFTILCGDWQRHNFSETGLNTNQVFKPIATVLAKVRTSGLPTSTTANAAVTVGNTDMEKDYQFDYAATAQPYLDIQVETLVSTSILSESEGTEMSVCGFYAKELDEFAVISLNTLLWTYRITPSIPDTVEDPCDQLKFLEEKLSSAETNGKKVIVMGHVPPMMDVKTVIQTGNFTSEVHDMFWKPTFLTRYNALLKRYNSIISTHVYGHTHMFTVLAFEDVGVPGFVIPSISPVEGNAPAYFVGSFSSQWKLQGMLQRFLNSEYIWTSGLDVAGAIGSRYGFQNLTDLRSTLNGLKSDSSNWENFLRLYGGGLNLYAGIPTNSCDSFCRAVLICSMLYSGFSDISQCSSRLQEDTIYESSPVSVGQSILTALLLILVSLFTAGAILLKVMYPKMRRGEVEFFPDIDWGQQLTGRSFKKKKTNVTEMNPTTTQTVGAYEVHDGAVSDAVPTAATSDVQVGFQDIREDDTWSDVNEGHENRRE